MTENIFDQIEDIGSNFRTTVDEKYPDEKNVTNLLSTVVSILGGKIIGTNDPEYFEINGGSLRIKAIGDFYIKLPMDTSPLRDNFTIAHELGHYFLHYKKDFGERLYARYGNSPEEIQANRFAAAFLMPRERFIKARKDYNDCIPLIAAHFQVSTDVVQERMKYING